MVSGKEVLLTYKTDDGRQTFDSRPALENDQAQQTQRIHPLVILSEAGEVPPSGLPAQKSILSADA
jgi:hypothetical protein